MAFENWNFYQVIRGGDGSKFLLGGYARPEVDAHLSDPPLRLLLVDDEYGHRPDDNHSGRNAKAFCQNFLALEDGASPMEPRIPVRVFFTDSFTLEQKILARPTEYDFDGILQDLKEGEDFPGEKNLQPMRTSRVTPKPGVLVVTQHAAEEVLERCKAGLANRFAIRKTLVQGRRPPRDYAEIKSFFRYAMLRRELRVSPLAEELQKFVGITTLAKVVEFLRKVKSDNVANERLPITVLGDTGTGKEHLAKLIHAQDRVATGGGGEQRRFVVDFKRFIPVLVGAIGEGVMEGEIFGIDNLLNNPKPIQGYFRDAAEGTLFFDELADIPLEIQGKLLRFLDDHRVRPIGGELQEVNDVRVVFATHSEGRLHDRKVFREDFIQRIDGLTFRLPTLKERRDEHQLLIDHFLARELSGQHRGAHIQDLPDLTLEDAVTPEVVQRLLEFCENGSFTGNVRQLDHFIRRLVRVSEPGMPIGLREFDTAMEYSLQRPGRTITSTTVADKLEGERHPLYEIFDGKGWNDFVALDRWSKGKMMFNAHDRKFKTREIVTYLVGREMEMTDGEVLFSDTVGNAVEAEDTQSLIAILSGQYQRNRDNWVKIYQQVQGETGEG